MVRNPILKIHFFPTGKNNQERGNKNVDTLPETNIAPENLWLEDEFPFGMAYFQVRTVSFRGCIILISASFRHWMLHCISPVWIIFWIPKALFFLGGQIWHPDFCFSKALGLKVGKSNKPKLNLLCLLQKTNLRCARKKENIKKLRYGRSLAP